MATVEVFFHTFSAVCQDLQELFSRTIKPLEEISAHLREGLAEPPEFIFGSSFDLIFLVELLTNELHLLAQSVVTVDEHATEHVVGGGIKGVKILLVLSIELP